VKAGFSFLLSYGKPEEISPQTASATADRAMRFFARADVISFFGLGHLNSD
jgi:hypothetical protein